MNSDIAVIGMACRFPGATSIDEFWDNLKCGRDTIREFSTAELENFGLDKNLISDSRYIKRRGVVSDLENFDHDFFGINPYDASITDPQHKVFLEICWEALETAGYIKERSKLVVGLFAGAGDNTYLNNVLAKDDGFVRSSIRYQADMLNSGHFLTTRVSYLLNLKGPSISIGTGCSTSLVAITQACNSLSAKDCDIAIAGGVTIRVPQNCGYLYQEGSIYSSDGRCRAFDAKASGTVPANGAGVVVLKRLEDAIRDGDTIDAVIKSYAVNNDASAKAGYTAPSVIGQASCITSALDRIDNVENVAYLEAHGTGTILGDPIEVEALSQAFRIYTPKKNFCALGSVKTNIGHTDVASGVAGFIKAILVLKNKAIPPSLNFDTPNPHISFDNSPFYVCDKYTPLVNSSIPTYVGVSSFGIGGTNAHVILGQAPQQQITFGVKPSYLILLSAKTTSALIKQQNNLLDYLDKHREQHENLSNAAATLQSKRENFKYRKAFICQDVDNLRVLLQAKYSSNIFFGDQELYAAQPKIAFIFHGQGNIYKGCVRDVYHNLPIFKHHFTECCSYLDPAIKNKVLDYAINVNAIFDEEYIKQVTMFVAEYSLAKAYIECGIKPGYILGYNLSEYVAYGVAGMISLLDAIHLVSMHARLVAKFPADSGLFFPLENVDGLFDEYSRVLNSIIFSSPAIPVISSVTGKELQYEKTGCKQYFKDHFKNQVQFSQCIDELKAKNFSVFIEIGFDSSLIKQHQKYSTCIVSLPSEEDFINNARNSLEFFNLVLGWCFCNFININWEAYYGGEKRHNVPLPSYPFDKIYSWIKPALESKDYVTKGLFIYEPYWELFRNNKIKRFAKKENWLVFADDFGFADKIVTKLTAKEQDVIIVKLGECFKKINDSHYQINPAKKNDYYVFGECLVGMQKFPDHVLHFWSFLGDDKNTKKLLSDRVLELGFFSLINFFQAAMQYDILQSACLTVVTNHCLSVQLTDLVIPEKSTMIGFCLVLPQETSNMARIIDVDGANLIHERQDSLFDAILNETAEKPKDVILAYRSGMRLVRRFKPYDPGYLDDRNNYLKQGGIYIILGGLGKIGLRLAEFLVDNYHAHIILIARNLGAADKIKKEKLPNLRTNSASFTVLEADVANYTQMEQAFSQIKNKFSQVDGVFHLAGVINNQTKTLIKNIQVEQVYEQLGPKIMGTRILAELIQKVSPSFCVGFSSLSALLGGFGLCSYAASNCGLNSLVESYQGNKTTHWLGLNWDAWRGDEIRLNNDINHRGLSYEQGFRLLQTSLCTFEKCQLIPVANSLEQLTKGWINHQEIKNVESLVSDKNNLKTDDIEASLKLIVQDCFGIKHVDSKDDFYDLGVDSLSFLRLQRMLDQSFPEKFRMNDLIRNRTIQGLMAILKKKSDVYASCLIHMKEKGSKQPLFLVHPIGGGVFCYLELAKYLTFDRKFIAIQDPMLESDKISFSSIEEMAKYYIDAIKTVQNKGPYLIGGYSLGANIAFEMAYQLENEGSEVTLIIIDGWVRYRGQILDRDKNLDTMLKIAHETSLKMGSLIYTKDNFLNLLWKRMEMLFRYLPKKIISEIILFKANELLPEYKEMEERANNWQEYTGKQVKPHLIDGNHLSILSGDGAREIARILNGCF